MSNKEEIVETAIEYFLWEATKRVRDMVDGFGLKVDIYIDNGNPVVQTTGKKYTLYFLEEENK